MEWSPQQEGAIKQVGEWTKDPSGPQVFKLMGYAGTGKTTLAKTIADDVKGDVCYGAFTGKAASVMRRKGCTGASTIHSMIYKLDDDDETQDPKFILNRDSDVKDAKLVIIDECSMVDEKIGKDLLSFGTKVLVIGDPAQLPPISGTGFFTSGEPDCMLTEVHRQARDNPIIRLSMQIRMGERLTIGTYGTTRILTRDDIDQSDVLDVDQVIVGLNKTRQKYNARIRELLGRSGPMPEKGDKLVCLRNDREKRLFNGTLWTAHRMRRYSKDCMVSLDINRDDNPLPKPRRVKVREEFFTGAEGNLEWQDKRGTQEFTYGYALTCHKCQGSQWDNITVFDEGGSFREDAIRWRYTAVTRAAEKLTMVVAA